MVMDWTRWVQRRGFAFALLLTAAPAAAQTYPAAPEVKTDGTAVLVQDYASLPLTSVRKESQAYPPPVDMSGQLGRANAMRSEPADAPLAAKRFFVADQNGILYILDKSSKKFTPYIDFGKLFARFVSDPPLGLGLVSIAFDPDYAHNGKFYTVHSEQVGMKGSLLPDGSALPGLNVNGYKNTDAVNPPGQVMFECIMIEWTDTNIKDSVFQGTAREILRTGMNTATHPLDEMLFNPLAKKGSADYGNMYVSVGDSAAGERAGPTHRTPQRIDQLQGKILRITPDINLRPDDRLSANGQYRIPSTGADPNPFVAIATARPEVFAYGFRNPHRLSWDAKTNSLIADDVGLHSWEEVNIIVKGGNYGWAEREGPEQVFIGGPNGGETASLIDPPRPFPANDTLTVDGLSAPVTPLYPAAVYSHQDGVGIGAGFVYRGKLLPQLHGKYIFTELSTGRIFYTDLDAMLAVHGIRGKSVPIHEIQVMYKSPGPGHGVVKRRMYDIVAEAFANKGGTSARGVMPGGFALQGLHRGPDNQGHLASDAFNPPLVDPYGVKYAPGRADVRLAQGGDGELYLLCKTDGWIRKLVAVTTPPPAEKKTAAN